MTDTAPKPANVESDRLADADAGRQRWKFWGPYLAERAWGTVREDYSANGDAWNYFTHDQAHQRAYRWNEDGLLGVSDEHGRLCLAPALWNGRDPILKERLFGLTNDEGNHGEDVKELYYYLDATPTHSYLKALYKYPQRAFPYQLLREENRRRTREHDEFELLDTGIFDDNRYFDVFVEYAKGSPTDLLMLVTVHNRGPDVSTLHVLPQLWFRNRWSWTGDVSLKPKLSADGDRSLAIEHKFLGDYRFYADDGATLLLCDNESNAGKLWGNPSAGYFKDAFHDYVVHGNQAAVNPERFGTKGAAHFILNLPPGGSQQVRVRLTTARPAAPFADFDQTFAQRRSEADEFYAELQAGIENPDARLVQRQAFAGMLWSKQFYHYDVRDWLNGDSAQPTPPPERKHGRNAEWSELNNAEIISMPDKWEYPWYAAWDLAFHCIPLALVDAQFAKDQLVLLTREWYMSASGQLPAYEWALGDVNPPVHAWAAHRVFQIDRKRTGVADYAFLERVFHKLMLNFTWWVNRKDSAGRNIFQGGFLGLDNIGVFNRSEPLQGGATLEQADATAWMAMYSLNLLGIAIELAENNPVYEDIATKFFEHFLHIAEAMTNIGGDGHGIGLWDEQDQFYYDSLRMPNGQAIPLRVRSMVGLIPLFAVEVLEPDTLRKLPGFDRRLEWVLKNRPDLAALVSRWHEPGAGERRLLSLLRGHRMKQLLKRVLDETEFLSDYGVRSLSKEYEQRPFEFYCYGHPLTVKYVPGDSDSGLFGGNSNWRGPVWMPVNFLLIESLQKFHRYYGDDFKLECPTGSGTMLTLDQIADELTRRLTNLFLRGADGQRPSLGDDDRLQIDPNFRDYVPFFEFFHGDTGRGLGASHQTGWTGLVAKLLQPKAKEA